jgi:hypothetical protein
MLRTHFNSIGLSNTSRTSLVRNSERFSRCPICGAEKYKFTFSTHCAIVKNLIVRLRFSNTRQVLHIYWEGQPFLHSPSMMLLYLLLSIGTDSNRHSQKWPKGVSFFLKKAGTKIRTSRILYPTCHERRSLVTHRRILVVQPYGTGSKSSENL